STVFTGDAHVQASGDGIAFGQIGGDDRDAGAERDGRAPAVEPGREDGDTGPRALRADRCRRRVRDRFA
ncbi:hypothetical protein AB0I99_07730, partial [Streptomyces spongiicola]|uniref:hypothetical protein n=1 Tax=Streptomyces spongiicola TaxID=1690221 RepID=UPI0033F41E15